MKIQVRNIQSLVKSLMEKHQVPGVTCCLMEKGEILESVSAGVKDDQHTAMTEDTLFEAASLTKPMFSVFFMKQVEKGVFSLDMPVKVGRKNVPGEEETITPRMVMSHTTGLPNWCKMPAEFFFEPGSKHSYSGQGFYELQHYLERVYKASWPELMDEKFFCPMGIEGHVVWTPEIEKQISYGFGKNGEVIKIRSELDLSGLAPEPNAAWSLYSNARHYASLLIQVMKDPYLKQMFEPVADTRVETVKWGLGFGLTKDTVWHWGDNTEFQNFFIFDKKDLNGIVIFTNSANGPKLYRELAETVLDLPEMGDIMRYIQKAE